uniref:Uncharacterized protein n=1 Tax=Rhizophora mucronata TaxID=61149 RepID=A0A2P2Q641_RHIMU
MQHCVQTPGFNSR